MPTRWSGGRPPWQTRSVLYVRISEEALRSGTGVAVCENGGVGVITVEQMRSFLGHCHVSVRPVLDTRSQLPVDNYEIPNDLREAVRLTRPTSIFPWTHTGSTTPDLDHNKAFVPLEAGGPPGQTCLANLGPVVRFGHRVKTHGRGWRHRQPIPGVYLWQTPHGYWFRVDRDGSHALGKDPDLSEYDAPVVRSSPFEAAFAELLAAA